MTFRSVIANKDAGSHLTPTYLAVTDAAFNFRTSSDVAGVGFWVFSPTQRSGNRAVGKSSPFCDLCHARPDYFESDGGMEGHAVRLAQPLMATGRSWAKAGELAVGPRTPDQAGIESGPTDSFRFEASAWCEGKHRDSYPSAGSSPAAPASFNCPIGQQDTHNTPGLGSNGEDRRERDRVMLDSTVPAVDEGLDVCREQRDCNSLRRSRTHPEVDTQLAERLTNAGLLPWGGLSPKTGYEPAEDNRQVPSPIYFEASGKADGVPNQRQQSRTTGQPTCGGSCARFFNLGMRRRPLALVTTHPLPRNRIKAGHTLGAVSLPGPAVQLCVRRTYLAAPFNL